MIRLKMEERQLLFKKYLSNGLTYDEADYKLKKTIKYLNNLVTTLKYKNKSESEITERFAREFEKLYEN